MVSSAAAVVVVVVRLQGNRDRGSTALADMDSDDCCNCTDDLAASVDDRRDSDRINLKKNQENDLLRTDY